MLRSAPVGEKRRRLEAPMGNVILAKAALGHCWEKDSSVLEMPFA